jgi:hypothetical protein
MEFPRESNHFQREPREPSGSAAGTNYLEALLRAVLAIIQVAAIVILRYPEGSLVGCG